MTIHNKARMIAYQKNGLKIESFAEVTNSYNSFQNSKLRSVMRSIFK